MPIIPEPETFPAADQKGSNEPQTKSEDKPKASAFDHMSKGPQIPDEMPPKASHEEIEARMKELNKSKKD